MPDRPCREGLGKVIGVAFWGCSEALRASEHAVSGVRSGAAEAAGRIVASVEEYEVLVNEAPSAGRWEL